MKRSNAVRVKEGSHGKLVYQTMSVGHLSKDDFTLKRLIVGHWAKDLLKWSNLIRNLFCWMQSSEAVIRFIACPICAWKYISNGTENLPQPFHFTDTYASATDRQTNSTESLSFIHCKNATGFYLFGVRNSCAIIWS